MAQSELNGVEEEVQLLDFWASPYVMRVKLALAAKGVAYTSIPEELFPNKSALLLQSNPVHKKVPVLLHKGHAICESLVICQYVDEVFPALEGKKDLLPKDPFLKASSQFWADFADRKVMDTLMKLLRAPKNELKGLIEEVKGYLCLLEEGLFAVAKEEEAVIGGAEVGYVEVVMGPMVVILPALQSVLLDGDEDVWEVSKLPGLQAWLKAFADLPLAAACFPEVAKITEGIKWFRKSLFPHEFE